MKYVIILIIAPLILSIASPSTAFMSSGHVRNTHFLDYRDFQYSGNGYSFTLVNGTYRDKEEFYLIIRGLDISDKTVFRKRLFIDFIDGNGSKSFFFPSHHTDKVNNIDIRYEQPDIKDVRSVK